MELTQDSKLWRVTTLSYRYTIDIYIGIFYKLINFIIMQNERYNDVSLVSFVDHPK